MTRSYTEISNELKVSNHFQVLFTVIPFCGKTEYFLISLISPRWELGMSTRINQTGSVLNEYSKSVMGAIWIMVHTIDFSVGIMKNSNNSKTENTH